jgi:hypothetical protein
LVRSGLSFEINLGALFWSMRADEVGEIHDLLDGFVVQEVFAPLARKDQRAKGGLYLQGLLLEGTRKSMQPSRWAAGSGPTTISCNSSSRWA